MISSLLSKGWIDWDLLALERVEIITDHDSDDEYVWIGAIQKKKCWVIIAGLSIGRKIKGKKSICLWALLPN